MSDTVRWGILGAGSIAKRFAASLAGEPRGTLVAASGRTPAHVEAFASEFRCDACADHDALLARDDVDAVYVALPASMHAEWSVKALEAGKAVLCEKPAALTAAEFSRVAQAAVDHDRLYVEAMKPRFTPLYQKVRGLVVDGLIGEVGSVAFTLRRTIEHGDGHWYNDPVGGGAALDLGIYGAAWADEYAGGAISVSACSHTYRDEVDRADRCELTLGDVACTVDVSADAADDSRVTISGSLGSIEVLEVTRPERAVLLRDGADDELVECPLPGDDFSAEIASFTDSLLSGAQESPVMPLADSLRCARIVDAMASGYDRYAVAEALGAELGEDCVALGEPMAAHTTFHLGGPADVFVTPRGAGGLASCLRVLREHGAPHLILGKGSDLLVSDAGCRGVVVDVTRGLDDVSHDGCRVTCQAGVSLPEASEMAAALSLTGLEFACGIPGTVGGAVFMNAGAYDGCIADVLESCECVFPDGHTETVAAADLALGYRTSRVRTDGLTVVSATFLLAPGNADAIRSKMDDLTERRTSKQPLELGSAGSTFKRPEGHFAGKLIGDAGLKGYTVGGAAVSEKHAGFVVNLGGATAADVAAVIAHVRETVRERFGVELEPEVRFVGPFSS